MHCTGKDEECPSGPTEERRKLRDVQEKSVAPWVYFAHPGRLHEVPDGAEQAAGKDADDEDQHPVQVRRVGIDGHVGRGSRRIGRCRDQWRLVGWRGTGGGAQHLRNRNPVRHVIALCEVGQQNIAAGDVLFQIFKGIWAVVLATPSYVIQHGFAPRGLCGPVPPVMSFRNR